MDRNREARRVPMAAAGNGLSRRRHRAGSFRDSPEEEGAVEVPEAARSRDRGVSIKKERDRDRERDRERERERVRERDRLHSRSKRRRGERIVLVHGNLDDGGDDSSEESVNDDEEYEDGGGGGVGPPKMLPPASNISTVSFSSSLSNHQMKKFPSTKIFRSSPPATVTPLVSSWKAADEMIGVSVPRKARSASTKRPHESWASSSATGDKIHRQLSSTPPAPTSPSSSNVSVRKKMTQQLPPKSSTGKLSSPVAVEEDIEIEIAEVLYGMSMPLATSKQESTVAANSSSSNGSAIAPKRKKPRHIKHEDENFSSKSEPEALSPLGDRLKISPSAEQSSSVLDMIKPQPPSTTANESNASIDEKKKNNMYKEERVLLKMESSEFRSDGDGVTILRAKSNPPEKKFEIDLMAPPPVRGGEMECVTGEAKPKVTEMEAKRLVKEDGSDAMILKENKKPRTATEAEHHKQEKNGDSDKSDHVAVVHKHHVQKQQQQQLSTFDKTSQASPLPLHMSMPGWPGGLPTMGYMAASQGVVPTDTGSAMQPPPHLLFNQPRPKRCATHCYIARNIQSHQQFTKMNPFWPAAGGSAPLYGTKACNLSLMPSTELQGCVLGRSSNPVSDKNLHSTSKSTDTAQRNQILLQQALPPGAANNMLHCPTFIFPMSQQPHAAATVAAGASVRPLNSGITSSGTTAASTSMNGSVSATPAVAPTMSFSYPAIPGNETQYLAILQNNGYPFPVPAHVGAGPPGYRGAPGQPIPFFNGSFYSSQMIQPPHLQPQKQQQQTGQVLQGHGPSNQNGTVSTSSSATQKHQQNQHLRPPVHHVNSQGYPTHKVQSQHLSFQHRQQPRENATQYSETVKEDSPSTADIRASLSNSQNFGIQMQPTNLGLMNSAVPGGLVGGSSGHGEKKTQQQGSKAGVEAFQSQGYAMTFAAFNGANTAPSLSMSSLPHNHAMFQNIPEAARQGYQMMAVGAQAQQKMNNRENEPPGSIVSAANTIEEQRKTGGVATGKISGVNGGQSIAFSKKHDLADASAIASGGIVDSSSRLLNLGSAQPQSSSSMPTSHHHQQQQQQHHMQRNQSQQSYTSMHLQKQQLYASSVAASAARTKGSSFPDHTASPTGTTKFPNANSGFPQNLVQSSSNPVQSQWKTNSPRAQSPSILSSSSSAGRNVSHKQQNRPQQSHISFTSNSKPMASGSSLQQVQGGVGTNNQSPSPPILVGSPSTSSVSKNASDSPRTTASASSSKAGQASASTTHSSSQPSKNVQSASPASSASVRNNGLSVLGNPATTNSGSKSQQQQQLPKHGLQQQQAQLFFTNNPYMQHQQQQHVTLSPGNYFVQRFQQQPASAAAATSPSVTLSGCTTGAVTVTSDPAKAIAAAATANNLKGGKTQKHQLVPPGFTYGHAVQVKPVDQKQQAGE